MIDTKALLAGVNIVDVVGPRVQLRKRSGSGEFVGRCVWHSPDNNPSMCVVPSKGLVWCPACGEGGDAIAFLMQYEGVDFKTACSRLNGGAPALKANILPAHRPVVVDRVTAKPPQDSTTPDMRLRELGTPEAIRPITDEEGDVLGYECRYPRDAEGKSASRMWTWGRRGDGPWSWGCGVFNRPRPLYGLHDLAHRLEAEVVVVEGPKKADAVADLMPSFVAVSWTGGAQSWHTHDWAPLRGRRVIIWPDADVVGVETGNKVAAHLVTGLECQVRVIDPGAGLPAGWDAADAVADGWDWKRLKEWIKGRIKPWNPPKTPQDAPGGDSAGGVATTPPPRRQKPVLAVLDGQAVAQAAEEGEPVPFALSDVALAEYFVQHYGQDWRYVPAWSRWFKWEGDTWQEDIVQAVRHASLTIVRAAPYWPEAATLTPEAKRKLSSVGKAHALVSAAQVHPIVAARPDQWDTHAWLLGVPGGVVDLRTQALLPGRPEHHITKRTAVAPAPAEAGEPTRWLQFLARVCDNDEALVGYLQRLCGYCLTGSTEEHSLAFLHGAGRNGKTTFLRTIAGVMGDYAKTAGMETFTESKYGPAHPTELARLAGARLVITEETSGGGRWNESRVKNLTGGGRVTAHFMRQDDFEYECQFKLVIAGNHMPQLRHVDEAMRSRFHLVPFLVTIPAEERDPHLLDTLRGEWPLILRWMLSGLEAWAEGGLRPCTAIVDASAAYMESEDIVGQWRAECCVMDPTGRAASGDLYRSYKSWCDARDERQVGQRAFSEALSQAGCSTMRSHGVRYTKGIELKSLEDRL